MYLPLRAAMDDSTRAELMRVLPVDEAWQQLPLDQRRLVAVGPIARILDAIETEQREPNDWEALDLQSALIAVNQGMYTGALGGLAESALTPLQERGEFGGGRYGATRTLKVLRAELSGIARGISPPTLPWTFRRAR